MVKKIGILGGTFDPPHIGHLIIAEEVRLALNLTEVWFIPSYDQPHKSTAQASSDDRLQMVQCAIQSNPTFKMNKIEIERKGHSYTIDTMRQLTEQFPDHQFYFIIGADMVEYLPQWKDIDELVNLIKFVGVNRPGFAVATDYRIKHVNIPDIQLSSTMIRERLANDQRCRYLIPNGVYSYIKENQLYGH